MNRIECLFNVEGRFACFSVHCLVFGVSYQVSRPPCSVEEVLKNPAPYKPCLPLRDLFFDLGMFCYVTFYSSAVKFHYSFCSFESLLGKFVSLPGCKKPNLFSGAWKGGSSVSVPDEFGISREQCEVQTHFCPSPDIC